METEKFKFYIINGHSIKIPNKKWEEIIEKTDDTTNMVMDILRDKLDIDPDSDTDDELYSDIHNTLLEHFVKEWNRG